MLYWVERGTDNEYVLVSRMIWHNFTEPQPNVLEGNSNAENDNVRICVSWKPKVSDQYESCNFFMRKWGGPDELRAFDGVKHMSPNSDEQTDIPNDETTEQMKNDFQLMKSDPGVWCSLNWVNTANTEPVGCKIRQIISQGSLEDMPWSTETDATIDETQMSAFDPENKTLTLEWERPLSGD